MKSSFAGAACALYVLVRLDAATVVDDRFADANSQNQNLAAHSLRVFNGRSGTARADSEGAASFRIANAGGSEAIWAFFTDAGSPVRLGIGDKMSVSLTFSLSGFPANGQDVRFGVFDSLGTRSAGNLTGGMNDATFIGDPGYGLQFFASGAGDAFALARRANLTAANVFNTFADFAPVGGSAVARRPLAEDAPYTLTYTIERLTANDTRLAVEVAGESLAGYRHSAVESSATPQTSFDYFAFRMIGAAFTDTIRFHRLLIDFTPALPVITAQPQPASLTVQSGANVTLVAAAAGSGLAYQWSRDGVAIAGAVEPTLALSNVQLDAAGEYTLTVSNSSGSVASEPVTLRVSSTSVAPAPMITRQPAGVTAAVGEPASLFVAASGAGLVYRWFKDSALIPGAAADTLPFPRARVEDAGSYTVVVSNSSGSVASAPARLTVVSAMSAVEFFPADGATGVCVDSPLRLVASRPPQLGRSGRIRIRRASDGAVADTIDLAASQHVRLIGPGAVPFNYYPVLIDAHVVSIYPRVKLALGERYTVEAETGVLLDPDGAPFAGASWSFTTRTAAPPAGATALTVAADGTGDYCTVQGAVDQVPVNNPRRVTITVRPGVYREIVYVSAAQPFVTVRGENRWSTIVQYANNAALNSQRALFGVDAADFSLETITLINTTPKGGSQAEAFRGSNQRIVLNAVDLKSFQDTLWLQGLAFVHDAYIEGDVDFMWGNGSVFFQFSEFKMLSSGGYYTQIRNTRDRPGNVYVGCTFSAAAGVTGGYLSRIDPGVYPFSQMVLIDSAMGAHVRPDAWLLNNAAAAPDVQFWEHASRDERGVIVDTRQRAPFSRQLSDAEAARWRDPSLTLGGWRPAVKLTAAISLSGLAAEFSGAPVRASVVTQPEGLAVNVTYNGSLTLAPVVAGSYEIVATIDDPRYQGAAAATLVIRPRPVAISFSGLNQIADGTPKFVLAVATPLAPGIAVTYDGAAALPVAPGRYSVVAVLADPNYRGRAAATMTLRAPGPAQVTAFPGAEGAGELARGGRGGDVYHVTNLDDTGVGSLRQGIATATGPRTIVFDVSGTIRLQSRLNINKSFLTIAGQTAPGGGITIAGWTTIVNRASHVVIRYVRFRMGDLACPAVQDDALWVDNSSDVAIDHVSASWSIDETLSVTDSTRVTVQWSFIAESLKNSCHEKGAHGYGSLLRYGAGLVSFHHNLFAHHDSRNPRLGDDIALDFVNNVVYDWGGFAGYTGGDEEGSTRMNSVGNWFAPGPATPANRRTRAFEGGGAATRIHQSNNRIDGEDSDWAMFAGVYSRQEPGRFDLPQVETESAASAFERVLARGGASLRRDEVDARLAAEVRTGRGSHIDSQSQAGGWPALAVAPGARDADGDGMPDAWETARGLNPANPADGPALAAGGYTNLELYLESLVVQ